jgi:2-methylisocitrate lyase-like PEP mutase family enzyme
MNAFTSRRAAFRALHASGSFVIPNPWDIGSARFLAERGFVALATTSAGFAFSRGLPDTVDALPRDLVLEHVAEIVAATALPVHADFQSGYAADPEGVAASVRLCIATGVAGLSIEDSSGDPAHPLYELDRALARLQGGAVGDRCVG